MIKIVYPPYQPRLQQVNGRDLIFDACRKKWVPLTPEEWVRQNFLQYLLVVKQYPASLIAVEKEIMVGELKKRFDIVIYRNDKPWMIIECKEMEVPLDQEVIDQVLRYNIQLQVPYLVVTNGAYCIALSTCDGQLMEIDAIPD